MSNPLRNVDSKNQFIRSYGRIKSRKLSQNKNEILENYYPFYEFSEQKLKDIILKINPKKINLEIGFGDGDFLYNLSDQNKDQIFIGCEPYLNGMINLLSNLKKDLPQNILLFNGDFRDLYLSLKENFGRIFDRVFILFPDPWPKFKHYKRRLINKNFLDEVIYNIIKKDGEILMATDHDILKTWILSSLMESENFGWNANSKSDWLNFPPYWIKTKYQKKASMESRKSIIISAYPND